MSFRKNTYIDLFAGCGGLSLGLNKAGWNGVFAIEKSVDAFKTLEFNLINTFNHFDWPDWLEKKNHDIDEVINNYSEQLRLLRGKIDMIAGGPPCQGFSLAGRRMENDNRNHLVKSYVKFIELVQPKIIFFENVKGFTIGFKKNKKTGKAYSIKVVKQLEELGYVVQGRLIDFSEYGIPQKRTRFILVGLKLENSTINNDKEFFFRELRNNRDYFFKEKGLNMNVTLRDAISDLLQKYGEVNSETPNFKSGIYGPIESKYQKYSRYGKSNDSLIDSHRFVKHSEIIKKRFKIALLEKLSNVAYRERFGLKKSSTKILDGDNSTPTITTLPDDYIHYCEPRILTVREYARIQSFPDSYEFKGKYTTGGKKRVLEVPRYSQIGNAIPPLFGEQVGIIIKKILNNEES